MYTKQILTICALFFSSLLFAQNTPLPKDHPIAVAAPHLPSMIRYNGVGHKFYGEKFTYNGAQNKAKLNAWIKNYTHELLAYKVAMSKYLAATDITKLSSKEAATYYDLKTQWLMIKQLPLLYDKAIMKYDKALTKKN